AKAAGCVRLLDYLVGDGQQGFGHVDAEGLGGFEIDHELEPYRPQHWKVAGFFAVENATRINAELAIKLRYVGPIAHESAGVRKITLEIERRYPMLSGQRYDLRPLGGKEAAGTNEQGFGPLFHEARKSRVDVVNVAGIGDLDFPPN